MLHEYKNFLEKMTTRSRRRSHETSRSISSGEDNPPSNVLIETHTRNLSAALQQLEDEHTNRICTRKFKHAWNSMDVIKPNPSATHNECSQLATICECEWNISEKNILVYQKKSFLKGINLKNNILYSAIASTPVKKSSPLYTKEV